MNEEQEPHAFVPSGRLQHSLFPEMEYEPCLLCWRGKDSKIHAVESDA